MSRRTLSRSAGAVLLSVLMAALVAGSIPVAGHGSLPPTAKPRQHSADLAATSSSTAQINADPIPGDWIVTYGSPSLVTMTLSNGTYSVTAKSPVQVTRSSCYLPAGTLIATFSGSGGSYSGQHGTWLPNDCSFYGWDSMTFTLDGSSLIGVFADYSERPVFTKIFVVRKPDGRIRLGTDPFVGNDIYNTTGANQSRIGSATPGHSITFGISIQNDGSGADRFKVKATGTAVTGYAVKYFRGTTDITATVVAGTYQTASLAPDATYLITAQVTVKSTAAVGSQITRLVTLTSVGNSAKKDAVKFIGKRA